MSGFSLSQGLHCQLFALADISKVTVGDAQVGEGDGHREVVRIVDMTIDLQSSLKEFNALLGLTKIWVAYTEVAKGDSNLSVEVINMHQ